MTIKSIRFGAKGIAVEVEQTNDGGHCETVTIESDEAPRTELGNARVSVCESVCKHMKLGGESAANAYLAGLVVHEGDNDDTFTAIVEFPLLGGASSRATVKGLTVGMIGQDAVDAFLDEAAKYAGGKRAQLALGMEGGEA